ncbi:molybdenum cofactor guanylyltransferase MobA [Sulfurimonas sp. HSL-3221]|uniref:molybdenum cofactor guanylyltransferase MobA n=1 Tax=Thiomicrolovo sulfuroxydans TaxID=2894755 RepID=UPI001E3545DA|nr:molybdenum cofactor guanylyltransferase MobA [Sulfurimonas sp. HSL-3221]UFS62453.1 molybdenum cofactor guanylyltransferase MobA [Sulfurimonas sp. HSL-3221]
MPENAFPLPCIIFAGGRSSRMGRNKALLPFDGFATLAEYQYARLSPLFDSAFLSVKTTEGYPERLPYLPDDPSLTDAAPTAGFITAFRSLGAERIFALSVDTPFIDAAVIRTLLEHDSGELDAVIARTARGSHPLCGIYHRSLLARFEAMAASGDHKLGRMLSESRVRYVDFGDEQLFSNLNHPHEYEAALKMLDKK